MMKYLVRKLEIIEKGERRILPLHYIELEDTTGSIDHRPHIYRYEKEEAGAIFIGEVQVFISDNNWWMKML